MSITEVARVHTTNPVDLDNSSTEGYKTVQALIKAVGNAPGAGRMWYGRPQEIETQIVFFVIWESLEAHGKFAQSDAFAEVETLLAKLSDKPGIVKHFDFGTEESLSKVLSAPLTEILDLYLKTNDEKYNEGVGKVADALNKQAKGCHGSLRAWAVEGAEHDNLPAETEHKGGLLRCLTGWDSKEAQTAAAELADFKDHIALVTEGPSAIEPMHVAFREVGA